MCAAPWEYEWHSQDGAAIKTDASVGAALARITGTHGKGVKGVTTLIIFSTLWSTMQKMIGFVGNNAEKHT